MPVVFFSDSFHPFQDQLILAKIQKRGDQPKSKLRLVIKVHGSVTLENDKEISFAAASGDKYTFKSADGNPSDLADWKAHIEAQAKESIARLMRNEDHLFAIVETDAHDSAISEEDRKKKQYLARQKVASEIVEKEQDYTKKLGVLADVRHVVARPKSSLSSLVCVVVDRTSASQQQPRSDFSRGNRAVLLEHRSHSERAPRYFFAVDTQD